MLKPRDTARPLRVLHCLYDVAGNAAALARAECEIGLESTAVTLVKERYEFAADEVLTTSADSTLTRELRRWRLLGRAVRDFDVVHLNFGRSIAPPWKGWGSADVLEGAGRPVRLFGDLYLRATWLKDLPLLRAAGVAVFVTFQGNDVRQGDVLTRRFEHSIADHVPPGFFTPASDAAKRRAVRAYDRYADGLFALNPDLLHVLPSRARFVPYASIDPREWLPIPTTRDGGPFVVAHAPTNRAVKGTPFVVEAVKQLQRQGHDVELLLVEHLTHAEARRAYERADLLVDQLHVGWFGALAVEFMAMAKPVVCYLREGDLAFLDPTMRATLPIVNAEPQSLARVIEDLVRDPRRVRDIGAASRRFAEEWFDPLRVAADMRAEYERSSARRVRRSPASARARPSPTPWSRRRP